MKDTVRIGNLTELNVQIKLMERGFEIFTPVGDGAKCDLILINSGTPKRVQIKTSRLSRNSEMFNAYSCGCTRSKTSKSTKSMYTKEDIDFFATIDMEDNLYLIPVEEVSVHEPRLNKLEHCIL